jgi:pyruvate dehydrogenase E2 component (dihydrolipoamide acetyltransferase)
VAALADPPAAAGEGGGSTKGEVTIIELGRRERQIARRSAEVRAVVPSVELSAELNAEQLLHSEQQLRCGITALLVRGCASALRDVPRANGAYRDGRVELYSRVNVGVALATSELIEIPTVLDADRKDAHTIACELAGFAQRAREGVLSAPELSGATFTLSYISDWGVDVRSPLIVAPQAASLAAGPIREQPLVQAGEVVAGKTMLLTLAVDYRILHGQHAMAFLQAIRQHLELRTPQGVGGG